MGAGCAGANELRLQKRLHAIEIKRTRLIQQDIGRMGSGRTSDPHQTTATHGNTSALGSDNICTVQIRREICKVEDLKHSSPSLPLLFLFLSKTSNS